MIEKYIEAMQKGDYKALAGILTIAPLAQTMITTMSTVRKPSKCSSTTSLPFGSSPLQIR